MSKQEELVRCEKCGEEVSKRAASFCGYGDYEYWKCDLCYDQEQERIQDAHYASEEN